MGNGVNRGARTIYVDVNGKTEKIVFSSCCCSRDIKDLLAAAFKVDRWSNVILKDEEDTFITISPTMPANTYRCPYKLEVIPEKYHDQDNEDLLKDMLTNVVEQFNKAFKVDELKLEIIQRLNILEKRVEMEGLKVIELEKCKKAITDLKDELNKQNNKYIDYNRIRPFCYQYLCSSLSDEKKISLKRDIPTYPKYTLSQETIEYLKKPTFDIWHWEPNEMLSLLEHMYHELDLVHEFNINPITLKRWLLCVQENYRNNPFHNFRHCFCVTQMMYGMIHLCKLEDKFSRTDLGVLITASICHDLDHPGYNNSYQINARTELAIRYNDISPLENHHCAVAFQILGQPECNIFANVSSEKFKEIRAGIIMLILATDMARHGEILESFKIKLDGFDFSHEDHLNSLKMVLIKCCDISNEVRPMEISEPWLDCLLEEYFNQSDREKIEGLPVAPFMDRDKVTKPTAQIGFIKFVLIPMFECVSKLFSQLELVMVEPLRQARDHYEQMKAEDDAKQKPIN